ncbi:MAG: type II toxin-antitoxin system prevent-host-death family antitoxin [Archangium sp.]|nr:type II toxin-antitoxin system prevent-host-death family antitoxin [Archangium sp.]MDP3154144.1 type II toxin-antitoxin system prevent-host-death family antitoxin [Archangium sp.]MDP3569483.1 type II toxin-antitoxin system prevent-host-death family antitoxin [Archangium sp.]
MTVYSRDIVPLSAARSRFSELVDEAHAGDDKIITKNGEAYVAVIDIAKLDYYRQAVRERGQMLQAQDIERSLDDLDAGRVLTGAQFEKSLRQRIARVKKAKK